MNQKIADALNVEPTSTELTMPPKSNIPETTKELHDSTYESIKTIADVGEIAMFELAQLAAATESPRAYEVLAKLMNEIVSANEKLIDLKNKRLEIEEKEAGNPSGPSTVHNNLIVASTSEILKQLKGIDNEKDTT